jgi:hypothetical protein
MNKRIRVKIQGISPLLMHAYPMNPVKNPEKLSREEQAEMAAYRDPQNRQLFIPGVAVQTALVAAATYSKGKGRASLQKVAAACLMVDPERCDLGVETYEIDARPVVVPATKGRVVRYRPRLEKWECSFCVEYDPELMTEEQVRTIVDDAGCRVGLLDFRPAKKGPFGRFMVTEWGQEK